MTQRYATLSVEPRGEVEWLTLNRPDALNAMSDTMIGELHDYFSDVATRDDVRVLVLRGAGQAFCAGLDLHELDDAALQDPESALALQRRLSRVIRDMRQCPQVILGLVHGAASGGGFALALAADIRIAARDVRMNAAFTRVGLSGCDVGVSYFLPRIVGASVAAELLLTGRTITAERALATGLVSQVVALDELDEAAEALNAELLQASKLGLRLTKEGLNVNLTAPSLDAALALEDRQQVLCVMAGDFATRIAEFKKRRK